jgi:putative DNA methylase
MSDFPRLIEHAFPLKQTSLNSVHEKNVRHGHISTLHIWPARRPLAACRAALIATLLPDPSAAEMPEGMSNAQWQAEILRRRQELCERIGGKAIKKTEKKKMPNGQTVEREKEETVGGILHWLESEPERSGKTKWADWKGRKDHFDSELEWFREEIKKAYGGRAPKVLDPFAGGGSIPLEAMRLGCEATAVDINPVAWFILKCTLEYPQKLAGQTRPLPDFILSNREFMESFFKAKGLTKAQIKGELEKLGHRSEQPTLNNLEQTSAGREADLAWHVRAWGQWVLDRARRELAEYYPNYADFEPIKNGQVAYESLPMTLVPLTGGGKPDIESLNRDFSREYLAALSNPRWIVKPTVAYLWARTISCKNCRATVPLLKTRWLCKKSNKRVLLIIESNAERNGVIFGVETDVPVKGGNAAQRRENDRRVSEGTMSKSGVKCPCCSAITPGEDIRLDGKAGRIGSVVFSVVVDSKNGKQYRLPTRHEIEKIGACSERIDVVSSKVPFGLPKELISSDRPSPNTRGASGLPRFGVDNWGSVFTVRQRVSIGTFLSHIRTAVTEQREVYTDNAWRQAIAGSLCCSLDRMIDFNSELCTWILGVEAIRNSFVRYALPFATDFAEAATPNDGRGGFGMCVEKTAQSLETIQRINNPALITPAVVLGSALQQEGHEGFDLICTDPPYYDAIPYSDIIDFFHVWLRRSTWELATDIDSAFRDELGPKWNHESTDGELIDQASRFSGNREASRRNYEDGMADVFSRCHTCLKSDGRLVVVFANKQPAAWETLVSALIRGGFVVDSTWPIQTEQAARMQAVAGAALASSVWLVCKKRAAAARPGWDTNVLEEMKSKISGRLREYWDAGIRGPDFVWAATGPALEAYSKHPVVRKANETNATMDVGEFLTHVRRMVVDYVVGQVLTGEKGADMASADLLDEVTAYYLLHRHDFGLDEAPVGACILYATACGLSDAGLERTWDILTGSDSSSSLAADADDEIDEDAGEADAEDSSGGGSKVKLKVWSQRRGRVMGYEAPEGKAVPLIDRIHRVMHLWKDGDVQKVDEFLDDHALRRNELFKRVVQSLIELSSNSERTLLESISNHIGAKGAKVAGEPTLF